MTRGPSSIAWFLHWCNAHHNTHYFNAPTTDAASYRCSRPPRVSDGSLKLGLPRRTGLYDERTAAALGHVPSLLMVVPVSTRPVCRTAQKRLLQAQVSSLEVCSTPKVCTTSPLGPTSSGRWSFAAPAARSRARRLCSRNQALAGCSVSGTPMHQCCLAGW